MDTWGVVRGVRMGDKVTFTETFIDSLLAVNCGEEAEARSVAVDNELNDEVEDVVEGIGGAVRNGRFGEEAKFSVRGRSTLFAGEAAAAAEG